MNLFAGGGFTSFSTIFNRKTSKKGRIGQQLSNYLIRKTKPVFFNFDNEITYKKISTLRRKADNREKVDVAGPIDISNQLFFKPIIVDRFLSQRPLPQLLKRNKSELMK